MAQPRPSQRDLAAARKALRQAEMNSAIAAGRLVVRTMTAEERDHSEARRAVAQARSSAQKLPRR